MNKGTILGFSGSWSSGIAYLIVKTEEGMVLNLPCENTSTVRALDDAYGDVITSEHTVNQDAIKGRVIFYSLGDSGLLEGFTPEEEWVDE